MYAEGRHSTSLSFTRETRSHLDGDVESLRAENVARFGFTIECGSERRCTGQTIQQMKVNIAILK